MSDHPSQNQDFRQSPVPGANVHGQQPTSPPPSAYPQQGYAPQQAGYYPSSPPPGTFVGTTVHSPNQSWVSTGASVAGVVIAGRCLIGFVSSGIFFIIAAIIMYAQANALEFTLSSGIAYRNPLRMIAPAFLGIGIFFLVGGLVGIFLAYRTVQKRRAEANTATTTTVISPAPFMPGQNQTLYGQQSPGYFGAAGGYSSPGETGSAQQGFNQVGLEQPPPYNTQEIPNSPEKKY